VGLICRALIVAGIAFAVLGGVIAGGAEAAPTATLYVDNTNAQAVDTDNDCQTQSTPCATISYAVSLANVMQSTATTIDVLAGAYDEAVTITDEPDGSTLTITGGAGVTVTAPVGDSIFTATSDTFPTGKITLSDLTITGAQASGNGGGLEDDSAGVNLMNDTFSNDSASSGGALDTQGGNKIVGDTFVGDSASNDGGAISNNGSITATNDTFVGDTAGRDGGAISTDTGAIIENDTFSGDSAASGGALYNEFDATIAGDIFDDGSGAGSTCVDDPINGGSGVTDVGYNAADNSDCGMSAGNHDIVNAPETGTGGINLDPPADNGGPTQTMALGSDSVAIDHIPISTGLCPKTDQRGFLRPGDGGSACDVGAYESGAALPTTLTVVSAGSGRGTVTSSPAGIDCSSSCSASFGEGSVVTLTATPAAGSTFTGWSGGGCSGTGACQVTMTAAESVTATFDAVPTDTLAVSRSGTGSGSVTSSPDGIDCGSTCSAPFGEGSVVTLTATPAAGSTFTGWSGGGCSGTGACHVTLGSDTIVTATFTRLPAPPVPPVTLTVVRAGSGGGTVTSGPAGIDCGLSCSATFAEGTQVTLSAAPTGQSRFEGWSGACATASTTCTVTLSSAKSVTATFVALPTISRLSVAPRTFGAAARGPSTLALRPRSKLGTVVSYILNQAATVRFSVERLLPGRTTKQGPHVHCAAPAKHNRKDPRCTRVVVLSGGLVQNGKAGNNAFRFTGRLAGKELALGSYVLVASPSADGTAGTSVKIAFRVGSQT
jgi:Divergent InlB B-repeat domain